VVVEYDDGADLVLTARRDNLGQAGLWRVAALLAGTSSEVALPVLGSSPETRWAAMPRTVPPEPVWGLPQRPRRDGHGTSTVDLPSGRVDLIAALALLLHRYDPGPVRFALVSTGGDGSDDARLFAADITDSTPIGELPGLIGPVAEPADVLAEPPAVALLVVDALGGHAAGEYRPGLTPPFPVSVVWQRRPDEGDLAWVWYDESYVSTPIAEQFARHLASAAIAVATSSVGVTVGDVTLLTPQEIAAVLAAGRSPAAAGYSSSETATVGWASASTIHAAVEAAAQATPDAIAYNDAAGRWTYRALVAAAATMAGALREAGVSAGDRVGICLHRGADLIVVLLAILRAGATYVPMDVRHPEQRLRFTAQDAGVGLVVTDFDAFPRIEGVALVGPAELRAVDAKPPEDDARPEDTAYVIYTSGSTGRPKGVMVPHRNVLALLDATAPDMRLTADDVWTWFHSSAFDFSVWEIWGALTTGARLVGVSHEVSRSPEDFHDLLCEQRVSVLNQTPSAFGALARVDRARRVHRTGLSTEDLALRLVVFGGEPLDVAMLRDWFDDRPHTRCRLVNMFGITETTVHVTSRTVTPLDVVNRSRSVGTALPGWSVSVRDKRGRPLPFGVAGEIFVGGAGVAYGYLNREDLTAQRFVEDPFGAGRVYRSGDFGRLHPDGSLDHLGRLDNQVQLRGHRVELDEVRAVLLEDPGVQAAAVVLGYAVIGDLDSARLDAYVVTSGVAVAAAELRRRVAGFLPEYMVPSTVTFLDALPLTVNGKVDLARLPRPVVGHAVPAQTTASTAPRAPEEASAGVRSVLRRVWAEVFDGPVADEDDFFELGGNSLLAVRLSAGLRAAGLPPIAMRELYLHPRIDDLARLLSSR
jgi:amino acid adenylation domain-containing protein